MKNKSPSSMRRSSMWIRLYCGQVGGEAGLSFDTFLTIRRERNWEKIDEA